LFVLSKKIDLLIKLFLLCYS